MISFALFTALSAFYFTMFFTPGPNNAMPGYQVTWLATYMPPPLRSSPVVATKILIKVKMMEMIMSIQPAICLNLVRADVILSYQLWYYF